MCDVYLILPAFELAVLSSFSDSALEVLPLEGEWGTRRRAALPYRSNSAPPVGPWSWRNLEFAAARSASTCTFTLVLWVYYASDWIGMLLKRSLHVVLVSDTLAVPHLHAQSRSSECRDAYKLTSSRPESNHLSPETADLQNAQCTLLCWRYVTCAWRIYKIQFYSTNTWRILCTAAQDLLSHNSISLYDTFTSMWDTQNFSSGALPVWVWLTSPRHSVQPPQIDP